MTPRTRPLPLGQHRARVLEYLREIDLPFTSVAAAILQGSLPPAGDGDLVRPGMVLWACAACGGDERDAVPVAASFELFDRFMRLHDELLVDDADSAWGLGQSLNAGDALYALALRTLAEDVLEPERRLRVAELVARAGLEAIQDRHRDIEQKTVRRRDPALTGTALRSGALLAGAPACVADGFERAGRHLDAGDVPRALAAIEPYVSDPSALDVFREAAAYVAARAA